MEKINKIISIELVLGLIGLILTLFTPMSKALTCVSLGICIFNLVLISKPKK